MERRRIERLQNNSARGSCSGADLQNAKRLSRRTGRGCDARNFAHDRIGIGQTSIEILHKIEGRIREQHFGGRNLAAQQLREAVHASLDEPAPRVLAGRIRSRHIVQHHNLAGIFGHNASVGQDGDHRIEEPLMSPRYAQLLL